MIAVDAATDRITAAYSDVVNAHGPVATPDGEYLIAGSLQGESLKQGQPKDTANSQLFLIHPDHGHVMSTIPVTGWSHHQAITPDGIYVLSTHGARGNISVVDVEENKLVALETETGKKRELTLSPSPYHLNTITGTGKVYVPSRKKPIIWVVDQKTMQNIGEIVLPTGEGHQMAVVN